MVSRTNTRDLVEAILRSDHEATRKLIFDIGERKGEWSYFITRLLDGVMVSDEAKNQFHSVWIELGRRIRDQVGDDKTLAMMLGALLPKYRGETIRLYRGENSERYEAGRVGFCWTPRVDKAEMFGRGLNAYHGDGGILLTVIADQSSILAGPNADSIHLGEHEHTVDPFSLRNIEVLNTFPLQPSDR
ncbi:MULTISPECIES: hypothetical protein [unclassified Pseudomonas]|uniref:hypothetical protein n=1 Tax=unclassified Pseudomonas TaxID=196821 RepID=UPI002A36F10D|nr:MULTISPECIES: hypothetical protein [unclassified Pseudomonas]MDX9672275.1 hypothetical protein [Pseudomonas sp. P8_250]WPN33773.1 hypothetical protein QMK53_16315 [Pseudomonas sp. P8_139]WPN39041.1 hypothetical protein QMK55_15060 [Pseudomonas sp. P8_229]